MTDTESPHARTPPAAQPASQPERRLLLIWNARAGSADDAAKTAATAVLQEHADVVTELVGDPDTLSDVLGRHPERDVVVAGGDGALHRVVAALVDRGEADTRTVGLLPLGTGNDLARSLGIPLEPQAAARVVATGRARPMDLLVDDAGGIVVNAVHLGIGAEASRAAVPWKPWLRRFAYAVGGVLSVLRSPGWRLTVEVDGRRLASGRRRVLMVGIGNGATVGGGTPLAPEAEPDDAAADVVVSFATGPLQRLWYGLLLRRGDHLEHAQVLSVRGRQITVAGEAAPVTADGELSEPVARRTWRVRPYAWRITVPM